jgi:hypothetical protein
MHRIQGEFQSRSVIIHCVTLSCGSGEDLELSSMCGYFRLVA